MRRHLVLLAAFFMESQPSAWTIMIVISAAPAQAKL
jgi:hypothetical protein